MTRRKGEKQHGQAKHRFSINKIFPVLGRGETQQEPIPAAGADPGIIGWVWEPESKFPGQNSVTDAQDSRQPRFIRSTVVGPDILVMPREPPHQGFAGEGLWSRHTSPGITGAV